MKILAILGAYFLGAIPFGYLLVRLRTGQDVRSVGSGNIGATNVLRTTGRAAGILVLLLDIGKGYLAVWLMERVSGSDPLWMSLAALTVMAGHAFPIFLGFRGGKAVASFIGAFLCLTPLPLLGALIVFIITVAVTRFISLGSILAAGSFPFAVWLILHPPGAVLAASFAAGAFVVCRHKGNIDRMRAGNEHVFSFGGKTP